jgi:deazaflavin-dependent oxidoreductase (nitroreductase family)
MAVDTKTRVREAVRTFNKHVLNPVMLGMAGRRYWYAAQIRHVGRNSGRRYTTPVVVIAVTDGVMVPLPYGTDVDWLRNVLAAGRATIRDHGRTYDVVRPRVIDAASAEPLLPARRRRALRRFGVDHYVTFAPAG